MTTKTLSSPRSTRPPDAEVYTADDLAALLQCSARHVWRLHDAGAMPPAVRVGRLVRWTKSAIASWMDAGCPRRR